MGGHANEIEMVARPRGQNTGSCVAVDDSWVVRHWTWNRHLSGFAGSEAEIGMDHTQGPVSPGQGGVG